MSSYLRLLRHLHLSDFDLMELLHIADKQGNSMGQATRHEAISQGHSLLSAHVWIYNDNQEILLQKRAANPLITCCP